MSCHIVILGAGISGLATAWYLKKSLGRHVRVTLLEKNQRVGGWIQTTQTKGFLFEQGARSCRSQANGCETLALVEALGLQDQLLLPHQNARNRYIYDGERLRRMPRKLWEIPFNPLTKGWIKALWQDWRMPKGGSDDESIHTFFSRRLGLSWAENLIDPIVMGIYAGDCRSLSLKSCFPLFDRWVQQHGSLLRGAWNDRSSVAVQSPFVKSMRRFPLFSFKEGMETLPRALGEQLKESLLLGQYVSNLDFKGEWIEVGLEQGKKIKADYLISTLPTSALSLLIKDSPLLANRLQELKYTTVVIVNMGFDSSVLPLEGFGYLIPSKYNSPVLGCVWDSSIFPQQNEEINQTRLTLMMGGSHHPEVEEMSEEEIIEYALHHLHQHLDIRVGPQVIQIKKAQQAIPQYHVGYDAWKRAFQAEFSLFSPRLILSGNAWTGVSINDCIGAARSLSHKLKCRIDG